MSTTRARALLAELVDPATAASLEPDEDLVLAGVDSGDLIRLALAIEDRFDAQIDAGELEELRTLEAVDRLLDDLERSRAARGET
ncbi:MAG TPA: acyl carrier protein [Candidatus Dormibacteraeota bacterium]